MFERQRLFREVNNRIAQVGRDERLDSLVFLCECGDERCIASVTLSLEDYGQSSKAGFVLATDHDLVHEDVA